MTIHHHPSDETLLACAAGTMAAGPRLVISVHVAACAVCRRRLDALEAVGGQLLQQIEPTSLADDALSRVFSAIDAGAGEISSAKRSSRRAGRHASMGFELPAALGECDVGPWRWLGPGVRWSKVRLIDRADANIMLLRIGAGAKIPSHTHRGIEYTQVLHGAFNDGRARFAPGDFDEADAEVDHQPIVETGAECVCLAALEGRMAFRGSVARGLGWLVGM